MSYEPPTPPANLPTEIVNTLNEATPEHLRDVGRYAEALAEHKEREARIEEEADDADVEERPDDLPDDVPAKATITIKEINDIATATGSGGMGRRSAPSTKARSTRTNRRWKTHTPRFRRNRRSVDGGRPRSRGVHPPRFRRFSTTA